MTTASRSPLRRRCGAAAAAALLLVAGAAESAAALPVGEAQGVRIVHARSGATVVFSAEAAPLYRRIAGKRAEFECTREDHSGRLGLTTSGSVSVWVRAPQRRAPLRTGMLSRGDDYCRVWLAARTEKRGRHPRELIVSVPLTQAGAVQLDEEAKTAQMLFVLTSAGELADRHSPSSYPTPAQLVDALASRQRALRRFVVALAGADALPPTGTVGYWTDGDRQVVVSALSASGRRLFIQLAPDDVISTNVIRYLDS